MAQQALLFLSRAWFYLRGNVSVGYRSWPEPWAPLVVIVVAFFAGFFTNGAAVVEIAVAAAVYPTAIRGTGLGWALGVGRIGTIVGPALAGILLATGIATSKLFVLSAIPVVIGAVAAFVLTGIRRRQQQGSYPSRGSVQRQGARP